jgi:hypothetical protein
MGWKLSAAMPAPPVLEVILRQPQPQASLPMT